ncbi:MAG: polysaccharide deacetylase family protein [Patescibacteria group bacterium]
MNGFLTVCYHYIRPSVNDPFPRLLGTREDVFREHVAALREAFQVISLPEAIEFSHGNASFEQGKPGLLFTFDDGLSDHYTAARILSEYSIRGVFFIPASIFEDNLPINPVIIHYTLAHYGIGKFLQAYQDALRSRGIAGKEHAITFTKGVDDPMQTISKIKSTFKYKLSHGNARAILLFIYRNLFEKDFPNAMEIMHLNRGHIKEMLDMGHHIGSHTHSHPSIASAHLSDEDFKREVLYPKEYMESTFGTKVNAFSYPFGEEQDYAGSDELVHKSGAYQLAFTVDRFLNTREVSPSRLGRYAVYSTDSAEKIIQDLRGMIK